MDLPRDNISFENVWRKDNTVIKRQVLDIWLRVVGLHPDEAHQRIDQLVFVALNEKKEVIGISTAVKIYVKRLHNFLYAFRCMLLPDYRIPGLTSKLLVMTRDFLEGIHEHDGDEKAIGVITLVENKKLREHRNEAVWPASRMVYIGDTREGVPIRVYYFKGARI